MYSESPPNIKRVTRDVHLVLQTQVELKKFKAYGAPGPTQLLSPRTFKPGTVTYIIKINYPKH